MILIKNMIFKKVWNEDFSNFIYQVEGKNKPEKIKQINSSSILIECLIDNKKESGGRQILEIYKLLLGEQNKFIKNIINNLKQIFKNNQNQSINQEITYLLKELNEDSSISIQNAIERQIINIKQISVELYRTIESLIYGFSKKKCFDNNLNINYDKYNEFEINYELIEELLRKTLLYGKRQFNDESFNYIIYQAEADEQFSSNLNELISKCDGKYEELNEEKQLKINQFEDLSNILNSLDQLIFYVNHSNQ